MRRRLDCCAEAWQRGDLEELNTNPAFRLGRSLLIAVGFGAAATCAVLAVLDWTANGTGHGPATTVKESLARADAG